MLKFRVWVERISTGYVEVEAESREAARREVGIEFADIVWEDIMSTDVIDVEEVE